MKSKKTSTTIAKAFSLTEMVAVIVIVLLLAGLGAVSFNALIGESRQSVTELSAAAFRNDIDAYMALQQEPSASITFEEFSSLDYPSDYEDGFYIANLNTTEGEVTVVAESGETACIDLATSTGGRSEVTGGNCAGDTTDYTGGSGEGDSGSGEGDSGSSSFTVDGTPTVFSGFSGTEFSATILGEWSEVQNEFQMFSLVSATDPSGSAPGMVFFDGFSVPGSATSMLSIFVSSTDGSALEEGEYTFNWSYPSGETGSFAVQVERKRIAVNMYESFFGATKTIDGATVSTWMEGANEWVDLHWLVSADDVSDFAGQPISATIPAEFSSLFDLQGMTFPSVGEFTPHPEMTTAYKVTAGQIRFNDVATPDSAQIDMIGVVFESAGFETDGTEFSGNFWVPAESQFTHTSVMPGEPLPTYAMFGPFRSYMPGGPVEVFSAEFTSNSVAHDLWYTPFADLGPTDSVTVTLSASAGTDAVALTPISTNGVSSSGSSVTFTLTDGDQLFGANLTVTDDGDENATVYLSFSVESTTLPASTAPLADHVVTVTAPWEGDGGDGDCCSGPTVYDYIQSAQVIDTDTIHFAFTVEPTAEDIDIHMPWGGSYIGTIPAGSTSGDVTLAGHGFSNGDYIDVVVGGSNLGAVFLQAPYVPPSVVWTVEYQSDEYLIFSWIHYDENGYSAAPTDVTLYEEGTSTVLLTVPAGTPGGTQSFIGHGIMPYTYVDVCDTNGNCDYSVWVEDMSMGAPGGPSNNILTTVDILDSNTLEFYWVYTEMDGTISENVTIFEAGTTNTLLVAPEGTASTATFTNHGLVGDTQVDVCNDIGTCDYGVWIYDIS